MCNPQVQRIYPDPLAHGILYEPDEWELVDGPFVRHKPSHLIFQIDFDKDKLINGKVALDDWFSVPVHLCCGHSLPDNLTFLGRGAIAVYLQGIGVWKPEIVEIIDETFNEEDIPF